MRSIVYSKTGAADVLVETVRPIPRFTRERFACRSSYPA